MSGGDTFVHTFGPITEVKRTLGRSGSRWDDNIKMDVLKIK
jgi:hypothetical protein